MLNTAQVKRRTEHYEVIREETHGLIEQYASGEVEFEKTIHEYTKISVSILMNLSVREVEQGKSDRAYDARMVCFFITKKMAYLSYKKIGQLYGMTTIMPFRGVKNMESYIKNKKYPELLMVTENVIRLITHNIKNHYLINKTTEVYG